MKTVTKNGRKGRKDSGETREAVCVERVALSSRHEAELEVTEMKMLRFSWKDRIRNKYFYS